MRQALLILLLVLPGCIDSDDDNVTTVWAVDNSGTGVNTSGGGIVQITGLTVPGFVFEAPVLFFEEIPEPDREAVAEADSLVGPDGAVVDAIYTPDGALALVREPGGMVLSLLTAAPIVGASAPENALRLLPIGDAPLRVLVVLADGQAVVATRTAAD